MSPAGSACAFPEQPNQLRMVFIRAKAMRSRAVSKPCSRNACSSASSSPHSSTHRLDGIDLIARYWPARNDSALLGFLIRRSEEP